MKCLFVWVCGGALARIFFVGTFEHGKAVISGSSRRAWGVPGAGQGGRSQVEPSLSLGVPREREVRRDRPCDVNLVRHGSSRSRERKPLHSLVPVTTSKASGFSAVPPSVVYDGITNSAYVAVSLGQCLDAVSAEIHGRGSLPEGLRQGGRSRIKPRHCESSSPSKSLLRCLRSLHARRQRQTYRSL